MVHDENNWCRHFNIRRHYGNKMTINVSLVAAKVDNFMVNTLKGKQGVKRTNQLNTDKRQPIYNSDQSSGQRKMDAIFQKERPKTPKQQRSFIGAVFFYRDMFKRKSHLIVPVTDLVKHKTLKWTPECQQAFDTIKAIIAKDTFFLRYPNHKNHFKSSKTRVIHNQEQ